jgi:hypothetical protein
VPRLPASPGSRICSRRAWQICSGKQNPVVPLSVAGLYDKQIAGSKLVTFHQCGYMLEIEKSAEFIKQG